MTRSAAAIGAGLAPARASRAIRPGERIHVVGAAGAGAAAAALLAARAGADVSACDTGGPSQYTTPLEAAGVPIAWTHDPAHVTTLPLPDRLAVTKALTSVDPDHPELVAARDHGVPLEAWQQVVADAAFGRTLIGVSGTHGKSTTTGWLVHILVAAGADPGAFVGALLPAALTGGEASTVRAGVGPAFVVEADEYAGNFDPYRPAIGLVTTADWDHPDVFADRSAVVDVLAAWIRRFDGQGRAPWLVANASDPGVREVLADLAGWGGRRLIVDLVDGGTDADLERRAHDLVVRYGGGVAGSDALVARIATLDADGGSVDVRLPATVPGDSGHGHDTEAPDAEDDGAVEGGLVRLRSPLAGRHMLVNGLLALGGALASGILPGPAAAGFGSFGGVGRRLETKGDVGGVVVLDDYGHHPTAMTATFEAVRQRYPGRPIRVVYEPLTFHRTAAMLDAFADVLATVDEATIIDIWPVRDPDTTIVSAADLAAAIERRTGRETLAPGSPEATADRLVDIVRPGEVVLVMGGGRSYVTAERLVELLAERAGPG